MVMFTFCCFAFLFSVTRILLATAKLVQFCEFATFFGISFKKKFHFINLLPFFGCYSCTFSTFLINATMKPVTIFIAVLGSAAAGLAAGMLLAPRKGSETRDNIMEFIRRHCHDLRAAHPPKI
jgi:hypothetical protein